MMTSPFMMDRKVLELRCAEVRLSCCSWLSPRWRSSYVCLHGSLRPHGNGRFPKAIILYPESRRVKIIRHVVIHWRSRKSWCVHHIDRNHALTYMYLSFALCSWGTLGFGNALRCGHPGVWACGVRFLYPNPALLASLERNCGGFF